MGASERNDLLELLDDRTGARSTLITSQLPVKAWHTYLNDPTWPTPSSTGWCTPVTRSNSRPPSPCAMRPKAAPAAPRQSPENSDQVGRSLSSDTALHRRRFRLIVDDSATFTPVPARLPGAASATSVLPSTISLKWASTIAEIRIHRFAQRNRWPAACIRGVSAGKRSLRSAARDSNTVRPTLTTDPPVAGMRRTHRAASPPTTVTGMPELQNGRATQQRNGLLLQITLCLSCVVVERRGYRARCLADHASFVRQKVKE